MNLVYTCRAQNRFGVIITEIMADPSPQVMLPNNEWIEIKNVGPVALSLHNWRVADLNSQSGPFPNIILQPDSFLIVCAVSAVSNMSVYGRTVSVSSFPSLDNEQDLIYIKSSTGEIIHFVSYQNTWYKNSLKQEGGWSLEMIDPANPCSGDGNWTACIDASGGSPGRINSKNAVNKDFQPPKPRHAYTTDSMSIIVVFDEPLDSFSATMLAGYTIENGPAIVAATCLVPGFTEVMLRTNQPLIAGITYKLRCMSVKDCCGNAILNPQQVRVGLPENPLGGDCLVNEILFNPVTTGYDYIEFYNNSKKVIDASRLFIAGRNNSGNLVSLVPLSAIPFYIFPDEYLVVTTEPTAMSRQYLVKHPERILDIASVPSMPDNEGIIVVMDAQGNVIDELHYHENWHFGLISNNEGVALERIDPGGRTQDRGNWHSAAATAGYGTPGYINSQYKLPSTSIAGISVHPPVFSPDNDGRDDITSLMFEIPQTGFVANVMIFDLAGHPVRHLVKSQTLALKGHWNWDGLDEEGLKLAPGIYIFFTEIFNLQGHKQRFKTPVLLAGSL